MENECMLHGGTFFTMTTMTHSKQATLVVTHLSKYDVKGCLEATS
jgi:hypothetical protein